MTPQSHHGQGAACGPRRMHASGAAPRGPCMKWQGKWQYCAWLTAVTSQAELSIGRTDLTGVYDHRRSKHSPMVLPSVVGIKLGAGTVCVRTVCVAQLTL